MTASWLTVGLFVGYLLLTLLVGAYAARRVRSARDFAIADVSVWRAATFLAGFTLGGASTYGIAGDTVKFGLTYLIWFPLSVAMGWWVTGLLFARPYHRLQGVTLPTLLRNRFDGKTRLAASLSTMLYAIFVVVLEIYTLARVMQAVLPGIPPNYALLASFAVSVGSIAFSGLLGSTASNLMHSGVIFFTFTLTLIVLWRVVGGMEPAFDHLRAVLPEVAAEGVDSQVWFSATGMGWGTVGQLLLGKGGRLGGVSVVSNLAASCRSEVQAVKAFLLAGLVSAIPPFLSGLAGVFTAALLGAGMAEYPSYTAIGLAVVQVSPFLAGLLLAAVAAAILSSFGPIAVVISTVVVDDIVAPLVSLSERQLRWLHPATVIAISALCTLYLILWGIEDILPFIYKTGFPVMFPPTLVALFGIYATRTKARHAFWAIALGVPAALVWGLVLKDPWGVHNIYVAMGVAGVILLAGLILDGREDSAPIEGL